MPSSLQPSLAFGDPAALDASLAQRVRGLVGSEILKIAAEIRGLVASGQRICNLTVGDFNPKQFPIPKLLCEGTEKALRAGETNYPPADGMPDLRAAVAEWTLQTWDVAYPVESVLVAGGARPLLYAAYQAVLNPGDTVVYPVPSWNNNHYAWLVGAEPTEVVTGPGTGFQPTAAQLVPHFRRAALVVLNTPHNPSGSVMERAELRAMAEALVEENRRRTAEGRRHLFLVFDQIYASLVFGTAEHVHPVALVPDAAPWVITVDGISKAFAATGLRVGWGIAAPSVVARMRDLVGHIGAWAPRAEQQAVAAFLRDASAVQRFRSEMSERVQERLNALHRGIADLRAAGHPVSDISPQGAIYLSLHMDIVGRRLNGAILATNETIRQTLLRDAGIGVVPFQAFGLRQDSGWFRLSVGAVSVADITEALPRLRGLLERLT